MSAPTTILFPVGSFYPAQTGGPDNTVYWLTKALLRVGYRPLISSTDMGLGTDVPRARWLGTDYGETIYSANPIHYLPLRTIYETVKRLRESDILHLSMITYPASWLTALVNVAWARLPVVWSVHGDLDPPMLQRSRRRKAAVLRLIRLIRRLSDVTFHTTCDAETAYVADIFGADAPVVQVTNYMELPRKLDLPRERVLLFVGRIDRKKGIENLLHALAQSSAFVSEGYHLKVAGDAGHDYGRSIVALAKSLGLSERVTFLGLVTGGDKQALLATAHCLIMPSFTENFGIVVTEALAQGTPAIASTGTPWAMLEERGAGWWTDNDPESLARCIDEAIALSPEAYASMSARALALVREEFDIHANIGEWRRAYENVLHG